jgi:hypothetical protein
MWVLARFGFAGLVFLFRMLWRRQGVEQSTMYRDTRRVTYAKRKTTGSGLSRQRVITKVYWGLELKTPIVFALTREGVWDRIFKFLGVAAEFQTGDAAFDKKIYVAGDHPALHRVLQEDARVRDRIVALFARGARRVFCDGRRLWVESADVGYPSDSELDNLHTVYLALKHTPARGHWLLDPFLWTAIAIEALVWSIALYGVPAFVEELYRTEVRGEMQRYFDLWALAKPGLLLAAGVFVVLFGLIVLLLRGSSRGHRILIESFLLLAVGLPISGMQAMSDFNISRDTSVPQQFEYRVVEKAKARSTGRGVRTMTYYLKLAPVTAGAPAFRRDLQVNQPTYSRIREGGTVRITSGTGRLSIPWIARIELP